MRYLLLFLLPIAGCAAPKMTVYGASGAPYIAPDLCAAELACKKANETSCFYNSTTFIGSDGKTVESEVCKVAK